MEIEQLPCFNLNLRRATRILNKIYDDLLSPTGLNSGQYSILSAIAMLVVTTNKELQSKLSMDQTTLTRNLKPLIRDGYILVEPGKDRRKKCLKLSESGHSVFSLAEEHWLRAQKKVHNYLGANLCQDLLLVSKAIVEMK